MITNINLRSKFRQYSQRAILSKMPEQFIGMAKTYAAVKRERMVSQQFFNEFKHEVSSIEKINQKLEKSLSRKKKQLQYVQAVRERYVSEMTQKQKLAHLREVQLTKLRNKTLEQKQQTSLKTSQAKEQLFKKKQSRCMETKKQLNSYKSHKLMQDSRLHSIKQSRVRQIEEEKARIRQQCSRFFKSKNKKSMQRYQELIEKQKMEQADFKQEAKYLQTKLLLLKQNTQKKSKLLQDLNSSIDSIRKSSRQSVRESKLQSTRSMTPLEVLYPRHASSENPQFAQMVLK